MFQPRELQTDDYLPWARARGTDVWATFSAAAGGDVADLKHLLERDPGLLTCEYDYRRPLHFAVRENQVEATRLLIEAGADPTYKSGSKWHEAPLTIARDRGYAEITALLESAVRESHHIEPAAAEIALLIRDRDQAGAIARLDADPHLISAADERGNQPLHWAVMTRQLPLIDYLLSRGADINAIRPDGARPLDLTNGDYFYRGWRDLPATALSPHEVLVGYLLARGAAYDISNSAKLGDHERVRAILDADPAAANRVPSYSTYYNSLPLACAAAKGHLQVARLLLERGADPNGREDVAPDGYALYQAVAGKHIEIAKLLLEHGANPNAAVESSGDCMWRAKSHPEMLALLEAHGGKQSVELMCYDGDAQGMAERLRERPDLPINENQFYYSVRHENPALKELILRHRPDILKELTLQDVGSVELARPLLEGGVDPNRTTWLGVAPLHFFAMNGKVEMAALALQFGADIEARDDEYRSTPLAWAARCGQLEMIEFLLAHGASLSLPDNESWTRPLSWAIRRGHADCADLLVR